MPKTAEFMLDRLTDRGIGRVYRASGDPAVVELLEANLTDQQHALAELELAIGRPAGQVVKTPGD